MKFEVMKEVVYIMGSIGLGPGTRGVRRLSVFCWGAVGFGVWGI